MKNWLSSSVLAVMLMASSFMVAQAASWGTSSASGYGSNATASGNVVKSTATKTTLGDIQSTLYATGTVRGLNGDNHKGYIKQQAYFMGADRGTNDSNHVALSSAGRWVGVHTWVDSRAKNARAKIRVMIDIPLRYDIYGNVVLSPTINF